MWINCNVGTLFTIGFCVRCTKRVTMNVRYHSLFEYWHWVKLKGRIIGEVSFYQNLSSIRFPMFQILNSKSEQWLYRTIDTRLKSTEVNTLEWFSIVYIKRRDEQHNGWRKRCSFCIQSFDRNVPFFHHRKMWKFKLLIFRLISLSVKPATLNKRQFFLKQRITCAYVPMKYFPSKKMIFSIKKIFLIVILCFSCWIFFATSFSMSLSFFANKCFFVKQTYRLNHFENWISVVRYILEQFI